MKVNVMQPCPTCKGNKKRVHPLWWALFKRRDKEPDLKAADFFLEHHILTSAERPTLLIPCPKCAGQGEVATWVTASRFHELMLQARMGMYHFFGGAPIAETPHPTR